MPGDRVNSRRHHAEPTPDASSLAPGAWLPLAFVVVALLALLITPLVVRHRVRQVRGNLTDVADEARLAVSEFETAFATELAASNDGLAIDPSGDTVRTAAVRSEREQERALDSLVGRLGGDAVERFIVLRTAEGRWRAAYQAARGGPSGSPTGARPAAGGRNVLAAADSLDRWLLTISTQARERVRRLERVDVYSAVALAPIALIAVGIVFMLDRQMRAFAHEVDDRNAQLARSIELRATLVRGVTHDIKNPLGAALGYAELLEDGVAGPMTEQQTTMVGRLKRLVGTAQQTVAELVDLARVDAADLPIDRSETDIVAAVRGSVDDYEASAAQKGLSLTLEAAVDRIVVTTDPTRLRHVLGNLLSNAIKYTPKGGAVSVAITTAAAVGNAATRIRVSVRDNGPGIPPALRERVFEEFFRVPSTERDAAGSGLGLAISRRIARLLGGDIAFTDAPGGGSIFTLWLPRETSPAETTRAEK